ncbi:MAG: S-layer homology domain-containing protein [Oscillospiraceae bacterium]
MRKICALLLILAIIFPSCFGTAFAEIQDGINFSFDKATATATLKGKVSPKAEVSLQVLFLGDKAAPDGEITTDDIMREGFLHDARQTVAGRDGVYNFTSKIKGKTGYYFYRVNSSLDDTLYTYSYKYYDPNYVVDTVATLNELLKTGTPVEIGKMLDDYPDVFELNQKYYQQSKTDGYFDDICSYIAANAPMKDVFDLRKRFDEGTFFGYINNSEDIEMIKKLLDEYKTIIGYGDKSYFTETYTKTLSRVNSEKVFNELMKGTYASPIKFCEEFQRLSILRGITYSDWGTVQKIIEENQDVFKSETLSAYKELKKKYPSHYADVAKGVTGKPFESLTALDSTIFSEIQRVRTNADKNNNSSSGSSGGGGGGGGGNIVNNAPQATPTPTPSASPKPQRFSDISDMEWAVEGIEKLADLGIINGKTDNEFFPNDSITREEFLVILVRAFEIGGEAKCEYADLDSNAWYYTEVSRGIKAGIAQGISESEFGVGEPITRQDICTMVYRAANIMEIDLSNSKPIVNFTDNKDIEEYAKDAIGVLSKHGIINGMEDGSFAPTKNATRAEAAKIVFGFLQTANKI